MQSAQAARSGRSLGPGAMTAIGLAVILLYCTALAVTMGRTSYDIWPAMILAPVLFAVTLPALRREATRQGDKKVFAFLVFALLAKFAFTILRYKLTFGTGSADAAVYHRYGVFLSDLWRQGDFTLELPHIAGKLDTLHNLTGTNFIRFFTGLVYMLVGPSKAGGFFFFSWLSFIGLYFFYRAFVIAIPEGKVKSYGILVFLFPTIAYWPSSIGKEAFMIFTLGIAAFGVARLLTGRVLLGVTIAAPAMWLGGIVRPHIPLMLGLGVVAAFVTRKSRPELRQLAPLVKMATLALVVAGASVLVVKTESFLNADLSDAEGITTTLENTSEQSAHGGSEFEPVIVRSPAQLPLAFATVLFRPFPNEAHSATALASALEGVLLALVTLVRWRWLVAGLKSFRRQPYVVVAVVYVFIFVVGFASFPNFGLLARQRAQLLPLYFVLLCIPPRDKKRHELDSA